jgi:hypothetical protein
MRSSRSANSERISCYALDRKVVEPNRIAAEYLDKRPVRGALLGGHARRQRLRSRPDDGVEACRRRLDRLKLQRRSACRGQLDVNRGEQLGVEQCAVLRAVRAINP